MSKYKFTKAIAGFVGLATAVVMMGGAYVLPVSAATVEELTVQINQLLGLIAQLQAQLATVQGGGAGTGVSHTFSVNLSLGDSGNDVMMLQKVLNSDSATQLASSGVGSPGNESQYFGPITKAAVIKFQDKYASEVLFPLGLSKGTGYVGASTRAKLNSMSSAPVAGVPTVPTVPVVGAPATGVNISLAASQPSATLAPQNATRLPFTNITFIGGPTDTTINGITIERTGLANDAAFSGIILLDSVGTQLGIAKTLNSNHQATIGDPFVVPAGQAVTMTIAGNMAADLSSYTGQIASLSVVGVNTSATVSGSLPLTGTSHTLNSSLSIGTVTMNVGATDPGASNTKEIGTDGYTFSSVKVTAGSNEKVRIKSIRWNQSGSATKDDIANIKTHINGSSYDVVVSSDGKYYTSHFGDGIVIDKGSSIDISIKGDIVSGSSRTVDFDVYKRTDLYMTGETFGYGINPPNGTDTSGTDDGAFHQNTNPWYDAYQATVSSGSLTVENATTVGAQNIAINTANQPIGGVNVEVKGESVSVAQIIFNLMATGDEAENITNITLVDGNGTIVAGPVDGASGATNSAWGTVTFTDTVTFPVGKGTYTLKGKLGTAFVSNDTVQASTTPGSQWTTVTGQSTGDSITPTPSSAITGSTMTVKAPTITMSVLSTPLAQTIVAGGSVNFSKYQFDASQSGDDIRFNTVKLAYETFAGTPTNLTNCGLYDGATALMSGSNLVNPTASGSSTTFTFDSGLVVSKGTVKTLNLNCNTSATTTTDKFRWGIAAHASAAQTATGVQSGQSIDSSTANTSGIIVNAGVGQLITTATGGSYTVTDDSTPGYRIVSPGDSVELLKLKFTASNEDIDIRRVAFELSNTASNTPLDLVGNQITLWNSGVQVGTATFVNDGDFATSTIFADGAFRVPRGESKTMTVKGTIASISGTVGPLTASGDLFIVSYDGDDNNSASPVAGGNYGTGVSGGTAINTGTTGNVTPQGVRIFNAYPTLAKLAVPSTQLQTSSDYAFYRFSVTANNDDIALGKVSFLFSSSTVSATTSAYALYAYTDSSFSNPDTSFSSDGLVNANKYFNGFGSNSPQTSTLARAVKLVEIYPDKSSATTTYKIGSGLTRYFELRANVQTVETGSGTESIVVQLEGDAAYPSLAANVLMNQAGTNLDTLIDADTNDDFIWSPISTTSSVLITDYDWTNGYLVPGLPTTNMTSVTHTSIN
ncbi:MAG: hypothetical protein COW88_00260 [Candidatus Lloydbacteria bacterium CG22_combo_CG10-13_8_21_14_all_47_15]|uniref:Peptidoglycan binding-like domain-containing protein n=1 Tax=Candidatus Lloydbacteria bacterium CG22_combo_CG10-13_8_21_14_all_47_15 TaxID=1974635 RepID=A0A2H0CVQ4_9BACT|nr:MAG: hypothetical protein COW88_00260 [Candidatus Lloydbacteria bacterium CG22_combo_CG10-13_8_21_14_all_47_15]